jgi:hypothetical protein
VLFCWQCGRKLTRFPASHQRAGEYYYVEREVSPGQKSKFHLICADTYDRQKQHANVTRKLPGGKGHGPDRDER